MTERREISPWNRQFLFGYSAVLIALGLWGLFLAVVPTCAALATPFISPSGILVTDGSLCDTFVSRGGPVYLLISIAALAAGAMAAAMAARHPRWVWRPDARSTVVCINGFVTGIAAIIAFIAARRKYPDDPTPVTAVLGGSYVGSRPGTYQGVLPLPVVLSREAMGTAILASAVAVIYLRVTRSGPPERDQTQATSDGEGREASSEASVVTMDHPTGSGSE